jgi:hypothetical protein
VTARDSKLVVEMSAGVSLRHRSGSDLDEARLERESAAESSSAVKGLSGCNDLREVERQWVPMHRGMSRLSVGGIVETPTKQL